MDLQKPEKISLVDSAILNDIPDSVIITDLQGYVLFWNKGASRIFGIPAEKMMGKHMSVFHESYDASQSAEALRQNRYEPLRNDWAFQKPDGEQVWLDVQLSPFWNENKELIGFIGISKDITQRKKMEQELLNNKHLLSRAMELGDTGIWDWNLDTRQPFWSKKMLEIYGYQTLEDIPAYEDWKNTILEEDKEFVINTIRHTLNTGEPYNIEFRMWRDSDQSIRTLRSMGELTVNEFDQTPHLLGVARDITAWKETENQLKESLEFNENIISNAMEGMVVLDQSLNCLIWNPTMEDLVGIKSEDVVGQYIFEATNMDDHKKEVYQRIFRRVLKGESVKFEDHFVVEKKSGRRDYWFRIVLSPNYRNNEQVMGIVAIISDISENKQKANDLMEFSERLRLAAETARIGIWKRDTQTDKSEWNDELLTILGVTSREMEDNPDLWLRLIHPEDRDIAIDHLKKMFDGEEVLNVEFRIIRPNGDLRYINASGKGICDTRGNVIQGIGINIDVTHLKLHESSLRQKNEELLKINRTLDTFVYHTSHNLRAPLANILGILEILKGKLKEEEKQKFIEHALQNVNDLDETIQSIIDYSYNSRIKKEKEKISMKVMVDHIIGSLSFMDGHQRISISNDIPQELEFSSDIERLRMIFLNLISNAIKYSNRSHPAAFVRIKGSCEGDQHVFSVEDNGIGIPEEQQKNIFEMFFRASDQGKGSGLGLFIVKEVVEQLKGRIELVSSLGAGTRFVIYLPG